MSHRTHTVRVPVELVARARREAIRRTRERDDLVTVGQVIAEELDRALPAADHRPSSHP